jgi:hypothetical protein
MDKSDLSGWLYNGMGSAEKPGDLGYWVGYRIAKAFYNRRPDNVLPSHGYLRNPIPKCCCAKVAGS